MFLCVGARVVLQGPTPASGYFRRVRRAEFVAHSEQSRRRGSTRRDETNYKEHKTKNVPDLNCYAI